MKKHEAFYLLQSFRVTPRDKVQTIVKYIASFVDEMIKQLLPIPADNVSSYCF